MPFPPLRGLVSRCLSRFLGSDSSDLPYFITSRASVVVNPFFIIRHGLYLNLLKYARHVQGRVLDIGCGSKPYERLFSNANEYIGVDVNVSGHDHSESRIDIYYDGSSLPFEESVFDSVVSFEVIEHVVDTKGHIREINRVLKVDGTLLLSVPFAWLEHEVPYDFRRYTSFGISRLLQTNGFEVVTLVKTTTHVQAVCQLAIAYVYFLLYSGPPLCKRLARLSVLPMNLLSIFLNRILPKRYDYFSNSLVLARKITAI